MPLSDRVRAPSSPLEAWALAEARAVAVAAGLDAEGAGVVRAGSGVLVGLPAEGVVVRVDDADRADDAARQVRVARALAARDVPAVRLVEVGDQPVAVDRGWVTAWRYAEPVAPLPAPEDVGVLACRLHDAFREAPGGGGAGPSAGAPGGLDLAELDPMASVEVQLTVARNRGATSDAEMAVLEGALGRCREAWAQAAATDPLGRSLVHGDLHDENVLVAAEGPLLVDLELSGLGPPSYDLVPQLAAVHRYGGPAERYDRFARAYGFDVRSWAGHEVLLEAYELWVTSWAVASRTLSGRHAVEALRRLEAWQRADGSSPRWELL